jgi:ribonuclease HII
MRCGFYYEKKFRKKGFTLIIGVDEAGRGPLAGPVVAAAVVLKKEPFSNRIDDSKKLSPSQRERVFPEIIKKSEFGIGIVGEEIIDRINILEATRLAMKKAVAGLLSKLKDNKKKRVQVLVDGDVRLRLKYPFANIIKGDAKSRSIAAASIIAKVTRDRIMSLYDKLYPEYGFLKHKGYPTQAHRLALKKFGPSVIHRKSFRGV